MPSLSHDARGIVLYPRVAFLNDGETFADRSGRPPRTRDGIIQNRQFQISAAALRRHLMIWDVVDIPRCPNHVVEPSQDERFLEQCDFIRRSVLPYQSKYSWSDELQLDAFNRLEATEPGCWAMQTNPSAPQSGDSHGAGRAFILKLHDMVPMPEEDVPFEQILEFKSRRRAELLAFRAAIEDCYQSVLKAEDQALAVNRSLQTMSKACADSHRAAKENGVRLKLGSLEMKIKASIEPKWMAIPMVLPVSLTELAVLAGLTLKPSIEFTSGLARAGVKVTGSPYEYLTSVKRELSRKA